MAKVQCSSWTLIRTVAMALVLGSMFVQVHGAQSQTFTVLHRFKGFPTDGNQPQARLLRDAAGNLYGTTAIGGAYGQGTIFKLSPTNKITVLFSFFKSAVKDYGTHPEAGLIADAAGNLYGTTAFGGVESCPDGIPQEGGCGAVFKLDTTGKLTVLHRFEPSPPNFDDGLFPHAGLILDSSGNLIGSTEQGGPN